MRTGCGWSAPTRSEWPTTTRRSGSTRPSRRRPAGAGSVGFFCQSGALGIAILDDAAQRGVGLSTFVSAGNRADVSGNDLLQYWDTDPADRRRAALPREFRQPAQVLPDRTPAVARTKPIVAVKSGRHAYPRSRGPRRSTLDDATCADLFEQSGVDPGRIDRRAVRLRAFLLGYQPLPAGPRVAVVGNSTALGVTRGRRGGRPRSRVRSTQWTSVRQATPDEFAAAVAQRDPDDPDRCGHRGVRSPVAVTARPYAHGDCSEAVRGIAESRSSPRSSRPSGIPDALAVRDEAGVPTRGSIPSYPDPERAAAALARAWPLRRVAVPPAVAGGPARRGRPGTARALVADWLTAATRAVAGSSTRSTCTCCAVLRRPHRRVPRR